MHLKNNKVLILSGGQGRRYGSPKALAIYNGETFLDIIMSKCLSMDLDIYVILNPQLNQLIDNKRNFNTVLGDSNKDMYDSILKGLKQIGDFSKLLIWPVDHPFVSVNSVKSLLDYRSVKNFVVPSFSRKLGHPVVFPSSALEYIHQCHCLKELISKTGRVIVDVNDEGILLNINERKDLP